MKSVFLCQEFLIFKQFGTSSFTEKYMVCFRVEGLVLSIQEAKPSSDPASWPKWDSYPNCGVVTTAASEVQFICDITNQPGTVSYYLILDASFL